MQYGTKGLLGEKFADIEEKYDLAEAKEGFGQEGEEEDASDDSDEEDSEDTEGEDNNQDNESGSEFFEGEAF